MAAEDRKGLHRLGDDPAFAVLTSENGNELLVATAAENRAALLRASAVAVGPAGRHGTPPPTSE